MPNARHSRLTCIRTTWRRASGAEEAPDRTFKTLSDTTGPAYGRGLIGELDNDLTRQHEGEPLGERIIVTGRVLDGDGWPVRDSLIEIWQANAAGRYIYKLDRHPAPLDPNFSGAGRCLTDDEGRYHFVTIKPGAYPWKNHDNAWRPAHIHLSLFGDAFRSRLITQMYFPGDPLLEHDPIFQSVRDTAAQQRSPPSTWKQRNQSGH